MSLYQKHRPDSFDQIIGNEDLVTNLRSLVRSANPPHAWLFSGPPGCGKTTLGRIVSSELGVLDEDYAEIDSADFRGIDTVRQIRHNAQFKPLKGENRAWLLDECHRLPGLSQDALLKGLEDPPPHAYFILCTTEIDKLLATIQSRCSRHIVKPLTIDQMIKLLGKVCVAEGKPLSKKILDAVARKSSNLMYESDDKASCHPRHALTLLEQVLAAEPDDRLKIVNDAEQLTTAIGNLVSALLKREGWKSIANILEKISEDDIEKTRWGILGYCKAVLLKGENDIAAEIIDKFSEPFYNNGVAGLTLACYVIAKG